MAYRRDDVGRAVSFFFFFGCWTFQASATSPLIAPSIESIAAFIRAIAPAFVTTQVWVADEHVDECMLCRTGFGLFTRRYVPDLF